MDLLGLAPCRDLLNRFAISSSVTLSESSLEDRLRALMT